MSSVRERPVGFWLNLVGWLLILAESRWMVIDFILPGVFAYLRFVCNQVYRSYYMAAFVVCSVRHASTGIRRKEAVTARSLNR